MNCLSLKKCHIVRYKNSFLLILKMLADNFGKDEEEITLSKCQFAYVKKKTRFCLFEGRFVSPHYCSTCKINIKRTGGDEK